MLNLYLQPPNAPEPVDSHFYIVEIDSLTAHKPSTSSANTIPMQSLREQSINRTLEVKRLLKGLVDLARVD